VLKVIVEVGQPFCLRIADGNATLAAVCRAPEDAQGRGSFVKTSTGFHPCRRRVGWAAVDVDGRNPFPRRAVGEVSQSQLDVEIRTGRHLQPLWRSARRRGRTRLGLCRDKTGAVMGPGLQLEGFSGTRSDSAEAVLTGGDAGCDDGCNGMVALDGRDVALHSMCRLKCLTLVYGVDLA